MQARRVARKIGELDAALLPGAQQALEGTKVRAPLELGVQREHLIARGGGGGQRQQVLDRILAASGPARPMSSSSVGSVVGSCGIAPPVRERGRNGALPRVSEA